MPAASLDIPPWNPPPTTTKEDIDWAPLNTLDLSQVTFDSAPEELIRNVGESFGRDGFMYAENHGLSYDDVLRQFSIGQHAFNGVAPEDKDKYKADIIKSGSFVGYKAQGHWKINGVQDRIEQLNFGSKSFQPQNKERLFPQSIQPFMPEIESFAKYNHGVILRKILTVLSLVLKLPADTLWNLCKDGDNKGIDIFRYAMYHTPDQKDDDALGGVRLQGHTDFGAVSILWSQPITSLEVLMPDNKWKLVKHRPNALVINLGDAMQFISNGFFKATIHRVVAPPRDQATYERLGMFYFALFEEDVSLEPLAQSPVIRKAIEDRGDIWAEHRKTGQAIPTSASWEAARTRAYGQQGAKKGDDGHEHEIIEGTKVTLYNSTQPKQQTASA